MANVYGGLEKLFYVKFYITIGSSYIIKFFLNLTKLANEFKHKGVKFQKSNHKLHREY